MCGVYRDPLLAGRSRAETPQVTELYTIGKIAAAADVVVEIARGFSLR